MDRPGLAETDLADRDSHLEEERLAMGQVRLGGHRDMILVVAAILPAILLGSEQVSEALGEDFHREEAVAVVRPVARQEAAEAARLAEIRTQVVQAVALGQAQETE